MTKHDGAVLAVYWLVAGSEQRRTQTLSYYQRPITQIMSRFVSDAAISQSPPTGRYTPVDDTHAVIS